MMTFIAGLVLLGVLVVVHELGHFLVAKWMGVKVLTFSVGFGPKLFAFKRGDTEYRISAIPLGGYVRMYGEQITDEVPEEEKKYSFLHQATWKKSAIAFAGPFFNFVFPILLFFFVFWGTAQVPLPVLGTVLPESAAEKAGLRAGDQIESVDGKKVDSFQDLIQIVAQHPGESLSLKVKRQNTLFETTVVPSQESSENPFNKNEKVGMIGVLSVLEESQVAVAPHSSAAAAGLQAFDKILAVEGKKPLDAGALLKTIRESSGPLQLTYERKGSKETLQAIIREQPGVQTAQALGGVKRFAVTQEEIGQLDKWKEMTQKAIREDEALLSQQRGLAWAGNSIASVVQESPAANLGLEPGDRIIAIDGVRVTDPITATQLLHHNSEGIHLIGIQNQAGYALMATRLKDLSGENRGGEQGQKKALGITFASSYKMGPTKDIKIGPFTALTQALSHTWDLIQMTVQSLWMFLSFKVPMSELGGPIAMFGIAGEAAEKGFSFYAFVMALISVNLGILNLLPIPVLDGGHLLLFGIEAVQRRPLSIKTRQTATFIGLVLLLSLTVIALFNDISRTFLH